MVPTGVCESDKLKLASRPAQNGGIYLMPPMRRVEGRRKMNSGLIEIKNLIQMLVVIVSFPLHLLEWIYGHFGEEVDIQSIM